ncbi:MAG: hypothetical protein IJW63_04930 [Lachnospiraceae bacterium]|nr:hypothetical protein [Lachnospiraceae bacterium]
MNKTYTYRLALKGEASKIHKLMEYVYESVADKDTFVCDDLSYVEKHIEEKGFVVVAEEISADSDESQKGSEGIIACLIVDFPGDGEENLGRDIELSEERLCKVVHMDSAVVHPKHRGHGLQGRLLSFAECEIGRQMMPGPFYLMATVSPANQASATTLEKLGYICRCTKEKYGGLTRRIYCKYMLAPKVFYVPGGSAPLSSEVFFIQGKEKLYVYDVGANEESLLALKRLNPETCILSHFHKDHTTNLGKVDFQELYVDKKSSEHFPMGTTLEQQKGVEDGVRLDIIPVATCHSKAALLVNIDQQFLLVGDALYAIMKFGRPLFNTGQLKEVIDALERIQTQYVVLSHDTRLVYTKEEALKDLRETYARRTKDSPYIYLD